MALWQVTYSTNLPLATNIVYIWMLLWKCLLDKLWSSTDKTKSTSLGALTCAQESTMHARLRFPDLFYTGQKLLVDAFFPNRRCDLNWWLKNYHKQMHAHELTVFSLRYPEQVHATPWDLLYEREDDEADVEQHPPAASRSSSITYIRNQVVDNICSERTMHYWRDYISIIYWHWEALTVPLSELYNPHIHRNHLPKY